MTCSALCSPHELLATVAHLHDAHAGALVVDEVSLGLLQHL